MSSFQQNQLQFNASVPAAASNLAVRYAKPQPFQIERISQPVVQNGIHGGEGAHFTPTGLHVTSASQGSFQFSAVSEDKLNLAVQLAKRDLRQKKAQQPQRKNVAQRRSPSPKASRTRIVHGKEYWDRMNRWHGKSKKTLPVREHDKNRCSRTTTTQTGRTTSPPRPFINTRAIDTRLPVTTNSPPTRDTDRYPKHKVQLNLEGKDEIEKLQLELESHLQQIQLMGEKALRDERVGIPHRGRVRRRDGYLSDEEGEERRVARADEFATRTMRNLYNLRQQVRQLHQEVQRPGPGKVKVAGKGWCEGRLAAAYRGALRTLQAFVNQLPYLDLRSGLPSSYIELSDLIRQLTSLSSRIRPDGDKNGVQRQLLGLLDQVDGLNQQRKPRQTEQVDASLTSSPPRKRSPVSRQLFEPDDEERVKQIRMQYAGKENRPLTQGKKMTEHAQKAARQTVVREVVSFPERRSEATANRQAILRAGLTSLLGQTRQASKPKPASHRGQPASHRGQPALRAPAASRAPTRPAVAWEIPVVEPASKKSLILPAKLQSKRLRAQKSVAASQPAEGHYADPTISANLKAVSPLRNLVTDTEMDMSCSFVSRSSSAPASPHVSLRPRESRTPERRGWSPWGSRGIPDYREPRRSRSHSPPPSTRHVRIRDVSPEVIRELFPSEQAQRVTKSPHSRSYPQPRGRSPKRTRGDRLHISESLVSELEREIRRRLLPDLTSAEDRRLLPRSVQGRTSPSFSNKGSHRDHIVDDLVEELLSEAGEESDGRELHRRARKEAVTMQDLPTLENLTQRLEEMEQERLEIRQRWATLSFDQCRPRTQHFSASERVSDRPRSPVGLEVTRQPFYGDSAAPPRRDFSKAASEEPLIFTNALSHSQWNQRARPKQAVGEEGEEEEVAAGGRIRRNVSLPPGVVQRIVDNRDNYDMHLKKMSHHPSGKFDPWKLVEEIGDQLLNDCLAEIAAELEDLNEDVASQMFKSEFTVMRSDSAASNAGPTPDRASSPSPGLSPDPRPFAAEGQHPFPGSPPHAGSSPQATPSPSPGVSPPGRYSPNASAPPHAQVSVLQDGSVHSRNGFDHTTAKSYGQYDDEDDEAISPVEYQETEENDDDYDSEEDGDDDDGY